MTHIIDVLNQIGAAKPKDKEAIILSHGGNDELYFVVATTLDSSLNFYTKKVNEVEIRVDCFEVPVQTTLTDFCNYLRTIAQGNSCTKAQQSKLDEIYTLLCDEDKQVAKQIVARKFRCGAGLSKWRIAYGESFLPDWGCMLSSPFKLSSIKEHIFKNQDHCLAYSECKTDGQRCEALLYGDSDVTAFTRKGKPYLGLSTLTSHLRAFQKYIGIDVVLDGELVIVDEYGDVMPRATGNGIINKFVKGKGDLTHEPNITFIVWDMIPREEFELKVVDCANKNTFHVRRWSLRTLLADFYKTWGVADYAHRIKLQESIPVYNIGEAMNHYEAMINDGQEGTILKAADSYWDPCPNQNRPNSQFKFKEQFECEFEIIDWYHGEKSGKYENAIGGFVVRSCDGKVQTNCGGGLSDEMRFSDPDQYMGNIITVAFNALSLKKGSDVYALQHPRYIETRHDKDHADSLERIHEQIAATRELVKCMSSK